MHYGQPYACFPSSVRANRYVQNEIKTCHIVGLTCNFAGSLEILSGRTLLKQRISAEAGRKQVKNNPLCRGMLILVLKKISYHLVTR